MGLALESGARHVSECIFDVNTIEGTRLIKHHVVIILGPLLALFGRHLARVSLVVLVAKAHEREREWVARARILEEASLPPVQRLEASLVGDVVGERAAVSSSVEGIAERLELFLTGRVPDLQRHHGVVNENLLLAEVGANGRLRLASDLASQVLLE